jgi:hypothetical protein
MKISIWFLWFSKTFLKLDCTLYTCIVLCLYKLQVFKNISHLYMRMDCLMYITPSSLICATPFILIYTILILKNKWKVWIELYSLNYWRGSVLETVIPTNQNSKENMLLHLFDQFPFLDSKLAHFTVGRVEWRLKIPSHIRHALFYTKECSNY